MSPTSLSMISLFTILMAITKSSDQFREVMKQADLLQIIGDRQSQTASLPTYYYRGDEGYVSRISVRLLSLSASSTKALLGRKFGSNDNFMQENLNILVAGREGWKLDAAWAPQLDPSAFKTANSRWSIVMFHQYETNDVQVFLLNERKEFKEYDYECVLEFHRIPFREHIEHPHDFRCPVLLLVEPFALSQMLSSKQQEIDGQKSESDRLCADLRNQHQQEIDRITVDHQDALNQIIIIACSATGGLGIVLFCVVLVFRCKWKTMLKERDEEPKNKEFTDSTVKVHVDHGGIPGTLKTTRPAILVDECEKFGMNEICDVTAGEGGDLVRIARPLETAGAARRLSEELMDIHPIYQDQEGRRCSELHATSGGDNW